MSIPNRGKIQTVLGLVEKDSLGPTLTHEHLLIDFSVVFQEPLAASERGLATEPVSLDNLGWVKYDSFRNADNLGLLDEETSIAEVLLFKAAGGGTIVDTTTIGIGRDPKAIARIARRTGLNIVIGAGYYVGASHPDDMSQKSEHVIKEEIINEIVEGYGGIKSGIIGELGCSWPLWENEKKVLKAGALAQLETGASIVIHPGRNEEAPFEILDILANAGANVENVVIGHIGRTYINIDRLLQLADTGCFLAYDQIGWESSNFSLAPTDFPSDAQRIDFIKTLVDNGYGKQVLVGHDVCSKDKLVKYGGLGFAHILDNIAPRMVSAGISPEDVQAILVNTPADMLSLT